jgi:TRAP-type C4-dicarboxylate transport system permease small subunit
MKKAIVALSFTVFVFGFAGWIYIALNATNHPETLALPLTHLLPWPREDVFGIVCFGLSFIALFVYMYMREEKPIK